MSVNDLERTDTLYTDIEHRSDPSSSDALRANLVGQCTTPAGVGSFAIPTLWPLSGRKECLVRLVYDDCLGILKQVHRETVGPTRPWNLRELLLVLEVCAKDRYRKDFDWGLGNAFDRASGAAASGPHHRLDDQYWNPVENSEVCCERPMWDIYWSGN